MIRKRYAVLYMLAGFTAGIGLGFAASDTLFFKISKNIDVFGQVYKEIVRNYVDEVDPEKFMHAGIDGMLETLDPYTVFIGPQEGDEIDLITSGEYGGVGISIGVRDGRLTVIAPMDGYSAQKQGIRAGDEIVAIDGVTVTGMNIDSVRARVRGLPGTTVRMKIRREGVSDPLEFVLVREEIQVNSVSYAGYIEKGIGYIRLERFSRRAGDEVEDAIRQLRAQGTLRGIILDLRDNPGGLLESAVDIAGDFLPKGAVVVTTRGRNGEDDKTYRVQEDPVAGTVPLAVLVNRNSASASEIVAGAIQDLDRGVIIGTRSFGKGLVQTIAQLDYNTQLKLTTARYYTPSGRSIQEIDYAHRDGDGVFSVTPDSLRKTYYTAHGRPVRDARGIAPDSLVRGDEMSPLVQALLRQAMFFKFATTYVSEHPEEKEFLEDTLLLDKFRSYLRKEKFEFRDSAQSVLEDLRTIVEKEHYGKPALVSIDSVGKLLSAEQGSVFDRHRAEIGHELKEELFSRYEGEKGRAKAALQWDRQASVAAGILESQATYAEKLAGPQ